VGRPGAAVLVNAPPLKHTVRADAVAVGWSLLAGAIMVAALHVFTFVARHFGHEALLNGAYPLTATLLLPAVQGFVLALAMGRQRSDLGRGVALGGLLFLADLLGAFVVLHEGVICLILASPLLLASLFAGLIIGRFLAVFGNRTAQASLVPILVLGVVGDLIGPAPDQLETVSDSVVIDAPPTTVWRYIVSYPENTAPPEYWLWRVGLPVPVQSVAEAPAVGARRTCRFSKGLAFDERIIELTPERSMTFMVTRQPNDPEAMGHFRFDKGQLVLTALPGNRSRLTSTSWYHLYVRPYGYFNWWTADIVRQVHFRVMIRMKALAERDYRTKA